MGCCLSRSEGPNSPYPAGSADGSSHAVAPENPQAASSNNPPNGAPAPTSSSRRRRRDPRPLDQHINRPLRRHTWTTSRRPWTRAELARERTEFFDTRVTGRAEIWQTLHIALQILWESAPEDASAPSEASAVGLATAQSLLEAAEISLPTGNLVNGVYDAFGNLYTMPEYIVSDPEDVLNDGDKKQHIDAAAGGQDGAVGEDQGRDNDHDHQDEDEDGQAGDGGAEAEGEDGGRRRLEKGKGVSDERETVNLRARLSDSGRDTLVKIQASEKVKSIIRKISAKTDLASNQRIRIAYLGKMLKENASLEEQGWQPGHVVNAMVFNR